MSPRNSISDITLFLLIISIAFAQGCASRQISPEDMHDVCEIFRDNRDWYKDAYKSSEEWGVPIPVLMAIMYQESKYQAKAKPPRTTCLFFIPGPRPSSAYGYAQAVDETWDKYRHSTGNWGADRDNFADAIDFIAWYCNLSHTASAISRNDAYHLYLAYHEGHNGFNRGTYESKAWLKQVAGKVQNQANLYQGQLASCISEFERPRRCCIWPF